MTRFYIIDVTPGPQYYRTAQEIAEEALSGKTLDWEKEIFEFVLEYLNNDTLTFETSGSTGTPRSISFDKKALEASALQTKKVFGLDGEIKALYCLPVRYIAGKMMIVRGLVNQWYGRACIPSSLPLIQTSLDFDFAAMVPNQVLSMLNHTPDDFDRIEKMIIGGAPISEALERRLHHVSTQIWETYGMTETLTHVASRKVNGEDKSEYFTLFEGITGYPDDRGCMVIEAPYLPEKVVTNDVVEFLNEFDFILKGRIDNVINSGGVKLHPESIEKKMAAFMDQRFYLSSKSDELLGEKLVLCIEGLKEDTEQLNKQMELKLSKFEIPKEIIFVRKFEETPTGKIKRNPPK